MERTDVAHGDLLEEAWNEVRAALPSGWTISRASYHPERREWLIYAFDPSEKPKVGLHSREWTAVAPTELLVVREMARCVRIVREGGVPK